MKTAPALVLGLCLALAAPLALSAEGARYLLVVSGLGGEDYYRDLFHRWSVTLLETAHGRYAIDDAHTTYLSAHPDRAPQRVDALSRKEAVLDAVAALGERSSPGDRVLIVLIGHGTGHGPGALFSLPGPDLAPAELDDALTALADRRVAVVNTTPASAPFVEALSAPGRVIISATATAAETQHTRFAAYFIEALANEAADTDKDDAVSLLEAFHYAKRGLAEIYRSEQRILTEHALLDDNGDASGSRDPAAGSDDGALARGFTLAPPMTVAEAGNSRVAAARLELEVQARRLVNLIERLKREKPFLTRERYEDRLESLLVALALNRRAYREMAAR